MFKQKAPSLPQETDFTRNLRETSFYRYGHLRSLGLTGEVTALAIDPVLSLFAIGTSTGFVHCYGSAPFQFTLPVSTASSSSPAKPIRFLYFHPGHHRLIAIDDGNTISTYSLQHMTDSPNPLTHPTLPLKETSYTLWGTVTSVDQPLPSHTHLFLTVKDGTTLTWDLSRRGLGNWKIGNCWQDYEERMIRSGIPGRNKTLGGPMATCIAMSPRDLNIILIGYEGGVVAWDMQQHAVAKTFEMILPPGSPGGGSYQDADGSLWTERTPSVTCITWRPDGLVFAVGHSDGCIALWAYSESDKPLMVRTITHEDVNVTDAESLLDAGALPNQIRQNVERDQHGNRVVPAISANREPIFKMTWAGFPDQPSLKALIAAQGTPQAGEPLTNATVEYAERGETLLMVLGGQSPGEKPGINILQFPAYKPPIVNPKNPHAESMPVQERYAFRDSLSPSGSSVWLTSTPPEDFVLLPRSSPYFNLSHDPISIIISLTPDPSVPELKAPHAARTIEAWTFPPPRSNVVPPPLGRRTYVQPGEGERAVAMTPAPVLSPTPGTPTGGGWKLPWYKRASSSSTSIPAVSTPDSTLSGSIARASLNRRQQALPSSVWSGTLSVLGTELCSLSTPAFKRLISWTIEHSGEEIAPRLPIHGGMAVPDLQSHGAPEVMVAKMESYRIMMTWHADCTVRFWDVSPHILILPTPLRFEYPNPLPHLTINIGDWLKHPDVAHLPLAQLWYNDRSKVQIKSVHLAREALECVITFTTGELLVTKFQKASLPLNPSDDGYEPDFEYRRSYEGGEGYNEEERGYFPPQSKQGDSGWVEEVLEIGQLSKGKVDGFKPVAIFTMKQGHPVSVALSDIGFIAVAFSSKSLAIIDMRGPDVILREGFDEEGTVMKKKKKKGNTQNVLPESSVVGSMKWVVSMMGTDTVNRPRLIVSYAKGLTKIYALINVLGEWLVEPKPPTFTNDSLAHPLASFVLDPLTGAELVTNAEALQVAMRDSENQQHIAQSKGKEAVVHCIWVAASRKSIRCALNYNGERISKVEMTDDEELSDVFYITRHGNKIIAGVTTTGMAHFYSVPNLQPITSMPLYYGTSPRSTGRLSIDDRSGDFIEYSGPLDINLRTFFQFRKPFPPRLDPCAHKKAIPPQPLPVTTGLIGWLWGAALTGPQLDALIGGPARPPPPREPPAPPKPLISWGKPPTEEAPRTPTSATSVPTRKSVAKTKGPARDVREREDVYSEMRNAAYLRDGMLDTLGDSLQSVSGAAGQYLSQAKNSAMKEGAKMTAKGMFGKFL
ncbi:hypothetical protein B9479_002420 [Cryptococcus floricola]|uniref:Lethal giant larvae (Lgl)-like C-terminal domain-containing protein n=1 Tax=Cryptococcus floricola TaxID=2591691 RepID=A0A5D3B3P1_9TREE|nr:hypothetical protein B9479_002420 [Cryptococcus floricola]